MARDIDTIYNAIITEKETFPSLDGLTPKPDDSQTFLADLTTTSKVGIWRLWYRAVAVAINVHEILFDVFEAEVEDRGDELITGTTRWYAGEALLFQNGDSLIFDAVSRKFIYDPITPANQIIERVAVIDTGAQVRIKIAKLVALKPAPLTGPEKTAFETYLSQIKFAGTSTAVTSAIADDFKVDMFIRYDAQVLATDGSLLTNPASFPAIDAIEAFIENLPFNGVLNLTSLIDAVQLADGVLDVVLNSASAKFGLLPYAAINKNYIPDAGHLLLDEPSSTFTYTDAQTF